ncbi:MAG: hypothetical protein AAB019_08910, partial [Planctomycetota bacterium]
DGTEPWTPAAADIASTGKIKIFETGDPTVVNTSPAFTVRCKLIIDTSNAAVWGDTGQRKWVVGTSKTIDWTNTGTTDNTNPLVLEWDTITDAFVSSVRMAAPVTGTFYGWSIPLTSTLTAYYDYQMRLRTAQATDGLPVPPGGWKPYSETIIPVSKAFKLCGSLVVTDPFVNEPRIVAASGPISWTRTGNITNLRIECSIDDGLTYPFLIASGQGVPPNGINWTIDRVITPTLTARIRIRDTSIIASGDPEVEDISDKFIIRGKLQLANTHPGQFAGQEFLIGTNTPITWTTTGIIPDVILEYTDNSGTVTINTISNTYSTTVDVNTGYAWTVPPDLTPDPNSNVRVTVRDARLDFKNDVYATSANPFKIKGGITVVSPNTGSEIFTVYDVTSQTVKAPITWTVSGPISQVTLYYSKNGLAGPWASLATVACGSSGTYGYEWSVPNNALTNNARISVTNTADATINDYSDNSFKIRGKVIVGAPNGGEVWTVGTTRLIQWEQIGDFNATVEYSTDDFIADVNNILVNDPRSDGAQSYSWPIPLNAQLSGAVPNMKVRVRNNADTPPLDDNKDTFDLSNASFKIRGDLQITYPNAGTFYVDDAININWDVTGTNLTAAKLYYRIGAGSWQWIKDVTAWDKTTSWTIPNDISNNVTLKITNANDENTVFDESGSFEIKGKLEVKKPLLNDQLQYGGATVPVEWKSTGGGGTFAQVRLSFSSTGLGGPWRLMDDSGAGYTVVANISGTNTYTWTVPDRVSSNCYIRVTSNDWQNLSDDGDAFKIRGNLTLQYPDGGEDLVVGANPVITWTKSSAVSTIQIEIDYGTGAGWEVISSAASAGLGTSGQYTLWTVADKISPITTTGSAKIQLTDKTDAGISNIFTGTNF